MEFDKEDGRKQTNKYIYTIMLSGEKSYEKQCE